MYQYLHQAFTFQAENNDNLDMSGNVLHTSEGNEI
jgi:hypothetical protein